MSVGIALANDKRAREGLYVAMSRGAQRNEVYAYPSAQEPAESVIGQPPAPDPEIARQRRLQADRESARPAAALDSKDPITILAPVVRRDDAELSATETREQALSDADHLGALHAIWMDQCRAEAYSRYAQAVRDHAEPGRRRGDPEGHRRGCGAPSAPPSWPGWTAPRSSGPRSPAGRSPAHGPTPRCWTPGSAR